MTGRYPLTIGMQYGGVEATSSWGLNETEVTLANVLQDDGYTNYMIGKWNLGHFSGELLPGARGFNYWLAYQTGSMFYWSKKDPESKTSSNTGEETYFKELIYGDSTCYSEYSGSDEHQYSTFLFRDKAISAVSNHRYSQAPLFMYLAFQAVHDPFTDFKFPNGVPKSYIEDSDINAKIKKNVEGRKRRQYAMSLYLMDDAVGQIKDAVEEAGQLDNTYFIFTSDNGGCFNSGGRNGPLRGNKGTLFEGGTKVDALVYSKLLPISSSASTGSGATYSGLFHVSDWMPTLLDMAGVSFSPASSNAFDGVSHWSNLNGLDGSSKDDEVVSPRSVMLYNYFDDVENVDGWGDTPVRAVRDEQYKLLESWDNTYTGYFYSDATLTDDHDLSQYGSCQQPNSWTSGTFTQYLFDLKNDPYEENNLWGVEELAGKQAQLYTHFDVFIANAKTDANEYRVNKAAYKKFKAAGGLIVPWEKSSDEASGTPAFVRSGCDPSYLSPSNSNDFSDTDPTFAPTFMPSTVQPTYRPTPSDPTPAPSRSPTDNPTRNPSHTPTEQPTQKPSDAPTFTPTHTPTTTDEADDTPSDPTFAPTHRPSTSPSHIPTEQPTQKPSDTPTYTPTHTPTTTDEVDDTPSNPTFAPTHRPSNKPSFRPTEVPTWSPSHDPTNDPTAKPTVAPSKNSAPSSDPPSDDDDDGTAGPPTKHRNGPSL